MFSFADVMFVVVTNPPFGGMFHVQMEIEKMSNVFYNIDIVTQWNGSINLTNSFHVNDMFIKIFLVFFSAI